MSSEEALQAALVVDDDPDLRAVLRHILELEGWRVVEAGDGQEALACALEEDLDVVITDIEMPRMDGIQLATRLRRSRNTVPLVALTRNPPDGENAALFDEVFTKPVSVPALREWLAAH